MRYTTITMDKKNMEYTTKLATVCQKYLEKDISYTDDGRITLVINPMDTAITETYYILEELIKKNEYVEINNIPMRTPESLFEELGHEYERVGNEAIQFEHDMRYFRGSTLYKQVKGKSAE